MQISVASIPGLLLDVVFPPVCGSCGAAGGFLCERCKGALQQAAPPRCRRCWALSARGTCADCSGSPLDAARAAYVFDGVARRLVHGLKFRSLSALARPMAELLAGSDLLLTERPDLLIPVPLHARRRRSRGFNQSELLARVLAEETGIALDSDSLVRNRNTRPQTGVVDRNEREQNLRGAFTCSATERVQGRRVVLLDDVLTTGATARECARALKSAGAGRVSVLAFCRVDLPARS
jgi:ComF family protein